MAGVGDKLLLLLVVFFQRPDDAFGQNQRDEEHHEDGGAADDQHIAQQCVQAAPRHRIVHQGDQRMDMWRRKWKKKLQEEFRQPLTDVWVDNMGKVIVETSDKSFPGISYSIPVADGSF